MMSFQREKGRKRSIYDTTSKFKKILHIWIFKHEKFSFHIIIFLTNINND